MRPGFELAPNESTVPEEHELKLLKEVIRDCHLKAISEWLVKQKTKIRTKFVNFLKAIVSAPPANYSAQSSNVTERFARDMIKQEHHAVIATVLSSNSEYTDVLHLLSIHMSRSNVMASIPSKRDETPKLLKAIAQEDHLFQKSSNVHHESPAPISAQNMVRSREIDPYLQPPRTKMIKPDAGRSSPFAVFPNSDSFKSTMNSDLSQAAASKPYKDEKMYQVLKSPTCL